MAEFKVLTHYRKGPEDFGKEICDFCGKKVCEVAVLPGAVLENGPLVENYVAICKSCASQAIAAIDKSILDREKDKGRGPRGGRR